jgi:phosphomevalonate kinase
MIIFISIENYIIIFQNFGLKEGYGRVFTICKSIFSSVFNNPYKRNRVFKIFAPWRILVIDSSNIDICIAFPPKIVIELICSLSKFREIHIHSNYQNKDFIYQDENWVSITNTCDKFLLSAFQVYFKFFPDTYKCKLYFTIKADLEFCTSSGKSSLGSSSALVSALIDSLLPDFSNSDIRKEILFQLASTAHSLAQGQIGSSFDVSCAIWKSQIFRRSNSIEVGTIWDNEHTFFQLPHGFHLILFSLLFNGSSTPSLVQLFFQQSINDSELYNEYRKKF